MKQRFYTANAFTNTRFQGAQIAVFPQAECLTTNQMQEIAGELNLSETVFICSEEETPRTKRLRIFSPMGETEFAGHPILAAAAVLAEDGSIPIENGICDLVFEQNSGPIDVRIQTSPGEAIFVQFDLQVKPVVDHFVPRNEEIAEFLSLEPAEVEHPRFHPLMVACDRPYLIVPLRSYEAVRRAAFNYQAWNHSSAPTILADEVLLVASQAADPAIDFHGRLMGPGIGVLEDPPIGSSMPAFAAYLCAHEQTARGTHAFSIERGTTDARVSILSVEMDHLGASELNLRVGGPAVVVCEGVMNLAERPDPTS
jgi:trans-2,3-dihydro-3-hydroxyanthranilate isomerase